MKSKNPTPKPPRDPSIVAKREAFANAVTEGKSPTEAARIAGYHPSNATNVMRQEDIQERIESIREEITKLSTLRKLDVVNLLLEAVSMARTQADPANMINAADKLNKMMGYYAPEVIKHELEFNETGLRNKLRQLTDEELMKLASGEAKVIDGEATVLQ